MVLTRQTKNGVLHTTLEALKSKIGICEKYFLNKSGGGLENIPKIYQLRYESSTLIIYKELRDAIMQEKCSFYRTQVRS